MKYCFLLLLLMCTILALPAGVMAQEATQKTAQQTADNSTYDERLALAREMHDIRPARLQVEQAIENAAAKLPPLDRETFKREMLGGFDFERLEELSIKAMAEVFTVEELSAMVAYYSSPEARAITGKMPIYEEMMQPEIMKMLDKALIKLRTGR